MLLAVLRELFPVLAVLYLSEGLAWLGARNVLFVRWPWGWRVSEGRRLHLAGLLPFDFAIPASGPVAIATSEALYLPAPAAQGGALYDPGSWTRMKLEHATSTREGSTVVLGGKHRLRFPSPVHTEVFTGLLEELRSLAPEARARRLARHRRHAFDLRVARDRLVGFHGTTALLHVATGGLFVLMVLLAAALYLAPSPGRLLVLLLVYILMLYAGLLAGTLIAGRLLRRDGALRRSVSLAPMLFSPVSAIRAVTALARELFPEFDALALAAVLLPKETFLARARAELHGAAFAASAGESGWRRHWEERRETILRLLAELEIGEAEALAPPARRDLAAGSWCPSCGIEYRVAEGSCQDCGLPLVAFPDAS